MVGESKCKLISISSPKNVEKELGLLKLKTGLNSQ